MADLYMSPRSYTYSGGDLIPYRERPSADYVSAEQSPVGVALGTEPTEVSQTPAPTSQGVGGKSGGFLGGLGEVISKLTPLVEAAVAFRRGYQTGQVPGNYRLAGAEPIAAVYADMRRRNEEAAQQARTDRENVRKENLRQQLIMAAMRSGKVSLQDALQALETGDLSVLKNPEALPSQQTPVQE